MAYYEGYYDFQGYQDPYSQDAYVYEGYEGYNQDYGDEIFQTSLPPPDKHWEDPVLINRSYLKKIEKNVVSKDYKGLNDLNMYSLEVFVSNFEIKNEPSNSEFFKDKNAYDFFTSVKILHLPFLELTDTTKITKKLRKIGKSDRVPSYTDLIKTIYTEAYFPDSLDCKKKSVDTAEGEELASVSEKDTPRTSLKERQSSFKKDDKENSPKDTKTYPLLMGKTALFTMTGLAMLKSLMKHEIKVRFSERVTVDSSKEESEDESETEVENSARARNRKSSKSSKDAGKKSVVSQGTLRSKLSMHSRPKPTVEGVLIGSCSIRMSSFYHQAVLEAALPDCTLPLHVPESRTEGYYPLVDGEGEEIGSVGISIMMACLGRAAVNCVRETINEGYKFEHTLFLNTNRFEPLRKAKEPPMMDAKLASFILKLGPVVPASKTSTEILQECLDNNMIQSKDAHIKPQNRNCCAWTVMAMEMQMAIESVRSTEETISSSDPEVEQDLASRWIDLRRICRKLQENMIEDSWDGSKEKSLFERLEEMRMSVDDSSKIENDSKIEINEEVPKQRTSSLANNHSISLSLKSNTTLKKTT